MKEKIVARATEMFLKYGFKSITMDDIANDMGISKKTIYKYFINKEVLIVEATETVHVHVNQTIESVIAQNFNPVEENFQVRKVFEGIFQVSDTSPLYQLKKHYPEIYHLTMSQEQHECVRYMRHNIDRGIELGYYRPDTDVENSIRFYWTLITNVNETVQLERDAKVLELAALIYHTRAIATQKGVDELEKQLSINA
ncbi:MAG: TetR/AcrR family transcriptional regulator [Flavobacterium sp.]|uniref:TetR/AcrR family transcriptional regulator n=1 Tax=Flavobacterium sp. TaxID=239 RepID=UPI001217E7B7|nr:TetR/AcrR family transcriptional regulator [Flavobacterium sp.]RZJ68729.1 MAG: TetR/AcrR family transcriptional regulator [Flavobacterium sp.]